MFVMGKQEKNTKRGKLIFFQCTNVNDVIIHHLCVIPNINAVIVFMGYKKRYLEDVFLMQ